MQLADAAIDALTNVLFGIVVLSLFCMLVTGILFLLLALRGLWRWLTRHSWRDVVVSSERKVLRSK